MSAEFFPTTLNNHGRGCLLRELPKAASDDIETQKAEANVVQIYCNMEGGHPAWEGLMRKHSDTNEDLARVSADYHAAAKDCAIMILTGLCPTLKTTPLANGVLEVVYKNPEVPRHLSVVE